MGKSDISDYTEMRCGYSDHAVMLSLPSTDIYGLLSLVLYCCLPNMSEYMVCCTSYSESYLHVWYSVALICCSYSHVTDMFVCGTSYLHVGASAY